MASEGLSPESQPIGPARVARLNPSSTTHEHGWNPYAIATLALGAFGIFPLFIIGPLAAFVCGAIAWRRNAHTHERGLSLAFAGVLLGLFWLALLALATQL